MISYRVGVRTLYLCTNMNESLSLLMQISSRGDTVHSGSKYYIMGVQKLIYVCIKKNLIILGSRRISSCGNTLHSGCKCYIKGVQKLISV